MNTELWRELAIQNNVDWYCLECDSHGIAYSRDDRTWHSLGLMPPYHSNLLFTGEFPHTLAQLIDQASSEAWSLKDTLDQNDLTELGFTSLFSARWLARPPGVPLQLDVQGQVNKVTNRVEFDAWQASWDPTVTVFTPDFYEHPGVRFYSIQRNDQVVAGLAVNRSETVVGITNIFGPFEDLALCIQRVIEDFPGMGLVGYESDSQTCRQFQAWGFADVGPLRIWRRTTLPAEPDGAQSDQAQTGQGSLDQ